MQNIQNMPNKRIKLSDQKENKSGTHPVMTWDITKGSKDIKPSILALFLREIGKKWVFQEEKGEQKGYEHYQIRISLHKKKRLNELRSLLKNTILEGAHLSQTSTNGTKTFDYVMKLDTRINGPWKDDDPLPEDIDKELLCPPNEFQKGILEYINGEIHPREILVVVDTEGSKGKTWLKKYLRWKKLAIVIPCFDKMEDIAQMVMCKPAHRCYIIDMPKSIKTCKMAGFWSGIEMIKDGYCYDKRNSFKDRQMPTPHMIVLTNKQPVTEHLSKDRWNIINI